MAIDFNDANLQVEHALRQRIMHVRQHIEAVAGASYSTIRYEQSSDNGKWHINSWGNGTADITTKGALLSDVLAEHIRRVNVEKRMDVLPALLSPPEHIEVLTLDGPPVVDLT